MSINILMTGEGPTDYGQKAYGSDCWEEGPAAILARRCAEEMGAEIRLFFAERETINKMRLSRHSKGLNGKAIPARRFYMHMKEKGYDHGIYYCDADRESGACNNKHQAEERFYKVYNEVDDGANPTGENKRVVPMVALRMIESWLVSDINVFQGGGKSGNKIKVSFPQEPELLWGDKRDPESNYPKNVLKRLCLNYLHCEPCRETYVSISEEISLDNIAQKCPISFAKFREDLCTYMNMSNNNLM